MRLPLLKKEEAFSQYKEEPENALYDLPSPYTICLPGLIINR
jgi:hypothetical protein